MTVKRCHRLGTCIDYERQRGRPYRLQVTAADRQGEGWYTRVPLLINVTDANDNPPVFPLSEYGRIIDENTTVFVPLLLVQVSDLVMITNRH